MPPLNLMEESQSSPMGEYEMSPCTFDLRKSESSSSLVSACSSDNDLDHNETFKMEILKYMSPDEHMNAENKTTNSLREMAFRIRTHLDDLVGHLPGPSAKALNKTLRQALLVFLRALMCLDLLILLPALLLVHLLMTIQWVVGFPISFLALALTRFVAASTLFAFLKINDLHENCSDFNRDIFSCFFGQAASNELMEPEFQSYFSVAMNMLYNY